MDKLTRFEKVRLISARTLQLALGAPPLVKFAKDTLMDDVAKTELEKGVLPLAVLREMPNGEIKRVDVA